MLMYSHERMVPKQMKKIVTAGSTVSWAICLKLFRNKTKFLKSIQCLLWRDRGSVACVCVRSINQAVEVHCIKTFGNTFFIHSIRSIPTIIDIIITKKMHKFERRRRFISLLPRIHPSALFIYNCALQCWEEKLCFRWKNVTSKSLSTPEQKCDIPKDNHASQKDYYKCRRTVWKYMHIL